MPKIGAYTRGRLERIIDERVGVTGGGGGLSSGDSIKADEGDPSLIYLKADEGDDAGDIWRLQASTSDTFAIGNDKASAGVYVDYLTVTGHATAASTTVATAGILKIGGNIIQASDGGNTITMDTSDNVTIAGDLTVSGGDATITAGEGVAANLYIKADEGDDAGDEWRVQAGTSDSFSIGSDKASAGSYVDILTLTPHATATSATTTVTGKLKVNSGDYAIIQSPDGDDTLRISQYGSIGIGKNPSVSLDVQGGGRVSSYWGVGTKVGYNDGSQFPANGGVTFYYSAEQRLYGGGVRGLDINASKIAINLGNADADFEVCGNSNDALLWCDADDECIGIHENDPMNALHIAHKGADKNDGILIVKTDYNDVGGYNSLTVATSDYLGGIGFDSQDGNIPSSVLEASAFIAAYAAEDHGTGDKGGDLVFGTTTINDDDDTASHEWMRIRNDGQIVVQNNIIASGAIQTSDTLSTSGSVLALYRPSGESVIMSGSSLRIGENVDGTDRTLMFGHVTRGTAIGIDDSANVFYINSHHDGTGMKYNAQSDGNYDIEIGHAHVTIGNNHTFRVGSTSQDGYDRVIAFGHDTNPCAIGIDDSADCFVIDVGANTVGANSTLVINSDEESRFNGKVAIDGNGASWGIGSYGGINAFSVFHGGSDGNDGIMVTRGDTSTADGDLLGGIGFDSVDGNSPSSVLEAAAFIAAYAAEAHGSGDKGGDLVFGTTTIDDDDDTASHEWMRILDSGYIGIGTSAPIAKLDVAGKIVISSESSTPAQPADGKGYLYTKTDGKIYWRSYDLSETDLTGGGISSGDSIDGAEGNAAILYFKADEGDDAGDEWRLQAGTSDTFTIGMDKASAGSFVDALTITGHATTTSINVATAGTLKVGGNIIQASDGGNTITMDSNDNVYITGDLQVKGGDIEGPLDSDLRITSDGNLILKIDNFGDDDETFQFMNGAGTEVVEINESGDIQMDGDLTVSGGDATVVAGEGAAANIYVKADEGDDAGDEWRMQAGTSDTFAIGSDKAAAGSFVDFLTVTGHATATSTTVATAGYLKVGANIIQTTVGGAAITMDNSNNVTVAGEFRCSGSVLQGMAVGGPIRISSEASTPAQPQDGHGFIYSKSDGKVYWRSYDVSEVDLTAAAGSGLQVRGALATTGSVLISTADGKVQGTELNIDSSNNLTLPAGSKGKATSWQTYSSARFKENVCVIEDPIEKLSRLKGVYFDWIGGDDGRDIGFIAEDVGRVLPEIVSYEDDGDNAISMSYDKVVPLLVEAFNESKAREKKRKKIFWGLTLINLALATISVLLSF